MTSTGWRSVLGWIVVGGCVVACGSSASGTGSDTASGSERGPYDVECTGKPFDAERYFNVASCYAQGGQWIGSDGNGGSHCRPSTLPCSYYGGSDGTVDARARCIAIIGCGVVEANGSVTKNTNDGGRCTGTAKPCEEIADTSVCSRNWGCESINGDKCTKNESISVPHLCEDVNQADDGSRYHPDVSRDQCEQRLGCVWKPKQ